MLRVPPEAQLIRCPACKTVLAVSTEGEEPPPLPFDPAPVKPAAPLAKPSMARPSSAPLAKAAAPSRPAGGPTRASESSDDPTVWDPNAKRRKRRLVVAKEREYEDLDDDEKKLYRKMERLRVQCEPGQTGMLILAWAYRLGALGHLALAVGGLFLSLGHDVGSLVAVIVGLNSLFAVVIAAGLGFCAAGPKGMRVSAGIGAAVALASVIVSPLAFVETAKQYGAKPMSPPELYGNNGDAAVIHYAAMVPTHFPPLVPGILFSEKYNPVIFFTLLATVLELIRHFVVCALARFYAEEGKDPDLGYRANRYLFRLALIMTGVTLLVCFAWALEQRGTFVGGQRFDYLIMVASLNLGVLTLGVSLLAQGQALSDISEIVTAERFADHARRLVTF
jgi:hypothetical protein